MTEAEFVRIVVTLPLIPFAIMLVASILSANRAKLSLAVCQIAGLTLAVLAMAGHVWRLWFPMPELIRMGHPRGMRIEFVLMHTFNVVFAVGMLLFAVGYILMIQRMPRKEQ